MFSLNDFYKDVIEWNSFSGNSYSDSKLVDVYSNLVEEEINEMFHEVDEGSDLDFLAELVDSLVVGSFLNAIINKEDYTTYDREPELIDDLEQTLAKLKIHFNKKNHADNISSILQILEDISYSSDMDVIGACEEIMKANWSKFPFVEAVNPQDEIKFIEKDIRYKGVTYEIKKDSKGQDRYVFKADTGKIVKPSTFEKAALNDYI
jgi:hypothetical protein